jgi:hypothetical protein
VPRSPTSRIPLPDPQPGLVGEGGHQGTQSGVLGFLLGPDPLDIALQRLATGFDDVAITGGSRPLVRWPTLRIMPFGRLGRPLHLVWLEGTSISYVVCSRRTTENAQALKYLVGWRGSAQLRTRSRSGAALAKFLELGLKIDLEPYAILLLERAQLFQAALKHRSLLVDSAHDLRVLALGVGLQRVGLLLCSLEDCCGFSLRIAEQSSDRLTGTQKSTRRKP